MHTKLINIRVGAILQNSYEERTEVNQRICITCMPQLTCQTVSSLKQCSVAEWFQYQAPSVSRQTQHDPWACGAPSTWKQNKMVDLSCKLLLLLHTHTHICSFIRQETQKITWRLRLASWPVRRFQTTPHGFSFQWKVRMFQEGEDREAIVELLPIALPSLPFHNPSLSWKQSG